MPTRIPDRANRASGQPTTPTDRQVQEDAGQTRRDTYNQANETRGARR